MEAAAIFLLALAVSYFSFYFLNYGKRPRLFCKPGTRLYKIVTEKVPSANKRYFPTWWCFESRAITILRYLVPCLPRVKYIREICMAEDGGEFSLNWAKMGGLDESKPIAIVAPGLTSTKNTSYLASIVKHLSKQNYRVAVLTYRGLDNMEVKTVKTYCATFTADLEEAVEKIHKRYSSAPIMLVGTSMGSILVIKYLVKKGKNTPVVGSVVLSTPFHPHINMRGLEETWINYILLNVPLVSELKRNYNKCKQLYKHILNHDKLMKCNSIREFDRHFTAPIFGYESAEHYYDDCRACSETLRSIEVPTLCVNADDDPFCEEQTVPKKDIANSNYVALLLTSGGGHVSHLQGTIPIDTSYFEEVLMQFASAIFNQEKQK